MSAPHRTKLGHCARWIPVTPSMRVVQTRLVCVEPLHHQGPHRSVTIGPPYARYRFAWTDDHAPWRERADRVSTVQKV